MSVLQNSGETILGQGLEFKDDLRGLLPLKGFRLCCLVEGCAATLVGRPVGFDAFAPWL